MLVPEYPQHSSSAFPVTPESDGWMACSSCGAFQTLEDDAGNDTETEDEVGELTPDEEFHYVGDLTLETEDTLREQYLLAKRRFRRFMRRAPRRVRFPKRTRWGKSKGRGFAASDSPDSWLSLAPVPAYPGMGKGKGSTIGPRSLAGGSAKGKRQ